MTSFATSRDRTQIAFETDGDASKRALVLVGGAFLDRKSPSAGTPLAALLADRFCVASYDRRARGDSDVGNSKYSVEREIEDLEAVVDAISASSKKKVALFGMSSGALLALDAAATALRDRVDQVIVYEPPVVVDADRVASLGALIDEIDAAVREGRRGDACALFLTRGVQMPVAAVEAMRKTPAWRDRESLAHTLAFDLRITARTSRLDDVKQMRAQTTIVDGDASPPWMKAALDTLAHAIPGAQRKTLAGQTHAVETNALAAVIDEALRS